MRDGLDKKKFDHLIRLGSYMILHHKHYEADLIRKRVKSQNNHAYGKRKYKILEGHYTSTVILIQNREFRLKEPIFFDGLLYKGDRVRV